MSPIVPTSFPLNSLRCACEQSSMTGRSCARAICMIASMSHGLPNRWIAMIAAVFSVIFASISAGSMLNVSASHSAKIGIAP